MVDRPERHRGEPWDSSIDHRQRGAGRQGEGCVRVCEGEGIDSGPTVEKQTDGRQPTNRLQPSRVRLPDRSLGRLRAHGASNVVSEPDTRAIPEVAI